MENQTQKQKTRELDLYMAQKVLGNKTYNDKNGQPREMLESGQSRPLRSYSSDMGAAWEVVEKMGISILPVEQGWFALVGNAKGWESPADFINYLQTADFAHSGAAVGESAAATICIAAMKAIERRDSDNAETFLN
ncbi:MAG: hypothetical protein EOP10_04855 [Proteobacteria bacterium]|nr:MAG: hypothetical protein EOP10_04855 [Pseudomonadota bacterium]